LVEPPNAITTAVMPRRSSSTTASPLCRAYVSRRRATAGGEAEPGSDMPRASAALAMVLAVYMPPQAPSPGQIAFSISVTSSRVIKPRTQAPTASNASMIVTSLSPTRPGMIEPA
jgi:hypothetical protein